MELSPAICYQAILSHDRRFDGLFFTCVASTGIYCRSVCPAEPKFENCTFVTTAAEAEKAGYRPCLRCRPEHAPSNATTSHDSLARTVAVYIDETLLADETLADVARRFSVSERHMRRLFRQMFGVEIKQYLTTRRLLFAKQLLQDSAMPITQVAYAAGFHTPGRLTISMRRAYGFTPDRLRKVDTAPRVSRPIILRADYRPPFNWTALLEFIQNRTTPHEWVADEAYHRLIGTREIVITNVPDKNQLAIQIPAELSRSAHAIVRKTRALFDLDANPFVIEADLERDPLLGRLIAEHPGLRSPGCWDGFEMMLRVIVGQQVTVAGATTVMHRLVDRVGATPDAIAASSPEVIAAAGMPLRRATTIWNLGTMVKAGTIHLDARDPQRFYDQLIDVPGIGPWTAEYLRMRILHWPDAFPSTDLGVQKGLAADLSKSNVTVHDRIDSWRPWRSYATMLLWKSLKTNRYDERSRAQRKTSAKYGESTGI